MIKTLNYKNKEIIAKYNKNLEEYDNTYLLYKKQSVDIEEKNELIKNL